MLVKVGPGKLEPTFRIQQMAVGSYTKVGRVMYEWSRWYYLQKQKKKEETHTGLTYLPYVNYGVAETIESHKLLNRS